MPRADEPSGIDGSAPADPSTPGPPPLAVRNAQPAGNAWGLTCFSLRPTRTPSGRDSTAQAARTSAATTKKCGMAIPVPDESGRTALAVRIPAHTEIHLKPTLLTAESAPPSRAEA